MFARYFVELPIAHERVEHALAHDPSAWLPGLAERANHRGDVLLADVGFGDDVRIARTVAVELGEPMRAGSKAVFPLRWSASGSAGLFPSLDADLEVAPLGSDRTQLAISARYVPPLGKLGRAIDRALLSRVAEATVKDFLDRVADTLSLSIGERIPSAEERAASTST
jgi:hypothetical protein